VVIKIRELDSDTWHYVDGIKRVTTWLTTNTDKSVFSGGYRCYQATAVGTGPSNELQVMVAHCEMESGEDERFIFPPGFAYLLNDSGKTIERLS
jgi:hypothetical protein